MFEVLDVRVAHCCSYMRGIKMQNTPTCQPSKTIAVRLDSVSHNNIDHMSYAIITRHTTMSAKGTQSV